MSSSTHELVKSVYSLLTRTLHAALRNADLCEYYHSKHTGSTYSSTPFILVTSMQLMSFLIGGEPAQTCDVIAHFVQRFIEVSAQDPLRASDATQFDQFTVRLIWLWERYHDLLFKYAALARAARAAGMQKPAFVDAAVAFILQMISKPPATQPYVPGAPILATSSTSPLRTSSHGSPSAQSEPAYVAQHAPYVLRAILERSSNTQGVSTYSQLDAKLLVTLVSASRLDITKWRYSPTIPVHLSHLLLTCRLLLLKSLLLLPFFISC